MRPGTDDGGANVGRRPSRDKRRLAIGLAFMAALLGGSLVSAFVLGRPSPGAAIAPGVPLLVVGGWALVLAAAVVFYRTYAGTREQAAGGSGGKESREGPDRGRAG